VSGAVPRAVAEPQLGNFGVSPSVSIPLGMRLDVWNDTGDGPTFNLYARNGQSIAVFLNQNAAFSLSGRLFSSVTTNFLNGQLLWALVDESSPFTWGPVTGLPAYPNTRITDNYGNALPYPWNGSGLAPAQGRFVGQLIATAAGAIDMTVGTPTVTYPTFTVGTASAAGQPFPFAVFIELGGTVSVTNATIVASGITV